MKVLLDVKVWFEQVWEDVEKKREIRMVEIYRMDGELKPIAMVEFVELLTIESWGVLIYCGERVYL